MQDEVMFQLVDKYLNGECSVEEEMIVINWYNSFDSTVDPISRLSEKQQEALKAAMLKRIKSKISNVQAVRSKKTANSFKGYYYAAASIAAAVIIVFSLLNQGFDKPTPRENTSAKLASSQIDFKNHHNRILKYILPDSTIVWLHPDAGISFNKDFVRNTRDIKLLGEAFFEVKKDAKHPFLIYSGGFITKVLGTSFNVKSYANQGTAEVSVVTGKVLVYTPASKNEKSRGVYLLPKQKVTYIKDRHQLVKLEAKASSLSIWEKNTLSFENASVATVVGTLNRTFKAKIVMSDPAIGLLTLRADFTDVNLPNIMDMLSKSLNITYDLSGDTIVISKPETN